MGIFLYFGIVVAIVFGFILCTYLMNGCKVTSPHNRRKPDENVRQPEVYVITTRTRTVQNFQRTDNASQNPSTSTSSGNAVISEPPPDYTTVDMREFSNSRRVEAEICPPPSYDEALKLES